MHYRMVTDGQECHNSEAAHRAGKGRTTLHRLIKTGDLSTCSGELQCKNGVEYFQGLLH